MDDYCYLTLEVASGISSLPDPIGSGAIQATDVRNFGNSHYTFKGKTGPGRRYGGLPFEIQSITIDNAEGERLQSLFH